MADSNKGPESFGHLPRLGKRGVRRWNVQPGHSLAVGHARIRQMDERRIYNGFPIALKQAVSDT